MTDLDQIIAYLRYLERTSGSPETKGAYGYAADGIERGEHRRLEE